MTYRGLFVSLALASIGIDLIAAFILDHSTLTLIVGAIIAATLLWAVYGTYKGSKIGLTILLIWLVIGFATTINDFLPIDALRNVFGPPDALPSRLAGLVAYVMFVASLVVYWRGSKT